MDDGAPERNVPHSAFDIDRRTVSKLDAVPLARDHGVTHCAGHAVPGHHQQVLLLHRPLFENIQRQPPGQHRRRREENHRVLRIRSGDAGPVLLLPEDADVRKIEDVAAAP